MAGFNSGAGMVAEYVKKEVLYRYAGAAAFLIAGVQQFLRAAKG
jgi:hypothetical protein